jgi:hypothetical protein
MYVAQVTHGSAVVAMRGSDLMEELEEVVVVVEEEE